MTGIPPPPGAEPNRTDRIPFAQGLLLPYRVCDNEK